MTVTDSTTRQRGRRLPLALAAIAIVAAIVGAMFAINSAASNRASQLGREVTGLQRQVRSDESSLRTANAAISSLSSQVGGLTVPTDPLASYDEICTIYADGVLGNALPWYLPCTTNATTIPQPGN